jgi:hypothetical protein
MAELHKFRDDAKTDADKAKPIGTRHLDENFKTVRLELGSAVAALFEIKQAPGKPDELVLSPSVPTSGRLVLGVQDGQLTFFETDECE